MKVAKFTLVKYRDAGLPTYTYFWITEQSKVYGPYFDSEEDANNWLNKNSVIVNEEKDNDTT